MFRDSPPRSPRDCVAMVSDTLGIRDHGIGEETGKGHGGAYKLRLNSQVMGMDRGDRGAGHGDGRTTGRGTRTAGRSVAGHHSPTATSESSLSAQPPHPTRVGTTFSLGEALA